MQQMRRQKNQRIWAFKEKKGLGLEMRSISCFTSSSEIQGVCEVFQGVVSSENSQVSVSPEVLGTFKKLEAWRSL